MTLASLLTRIAQSMGYNTDVSLGEVETIAKREAQLVEGVTTGLEVFWNNAGLAYMLPWELEVGSLTVTANQIDFADVDSTYSLAVFASDPRLTTTRVKRYRATRGHDAWYLPALASGTVFGFWVKAKPNVSYADKDTDTVPDELADTLRNFALAENARSTPTSKEMRQADYEAEAQKSFDRAISRVGNQNLGYWLYKQEDTEGGSW